VKQINRKYKYNDSYFKIIDDKEKAYFLGLLYSDGSVSDRRMIIGLQERDIDILEKFKEKLDYDGPIRIYESKNVNYQRNAILQICSREMVRDLTTHGCHYRKTYSLQFPNIDVSLYSHFIRGLFDGDGCITTAGSNYYYSIAGKVTFLEEVNKILSESCKMKPCAISRKNKGCSDFGAIQYMRNSTLISIRNFMYKECGDLYLKRKHEKFFSIEKTEIPVCCICGGKHTAKGYCITCYSREILYKKKRPGYKISAVNRYTGNKSSYNSIREAEKETGVGYHSIWYNIKGDYKYAGDFIFEKIPDPCKVDYV
jgi:hypothetical protein